MVEIEVKTYHTASSVRTGRNTASEILDVDQVV